MGWNNKFTNLYYMALNFVICYAGKQHNENGSLGKLFGNKRLGTEAKKVHSKADVAI